MTDQISIINNNEWRNAIEVIDIINQETKETRHSGGYYHSTVLQ